MAKVESVRIEDHSEEYIEEMKRKVEAFLMSIGETAASAAADIPNFPVDTGRLKESINWATAHHYGSGDTPQQLPEEETVYIGTNVDYAIWHEIGTGDFASQGGGRTGGWVFKDKQGNWHRTHGVPARHFIQYGAQSNWNDGLKTQLENYLKNG